MTCVVCNKRIDVFRRMWGHAICGECWETKQAELTRARFPCWQLTRLLDLVSEPVRGVPRCPECREEIGRVDELESVLHKLLDARGTQLESDPGNQVTRLEYDMIWAVMKSVLE